MLTSSLFLISRIHTEFLVIIFNRVENHLCWRLLSQVFERKADYFILTTSAYHLYGNFSEKLPSNGTGICFGTENRNGIELYHLQNIGKFFIFSQHEAWHW